MDTHVSETSHDELTPVDTDLVPDFHSEPYRDNEREYQESISVFRGILIASAISLPLWGIAIFGVWFILDTIF